MAFSLISKPPVNLSAVVLVVRSGPSVPSYFSHSGFGIGSGLEIRTENNVISTLYSLSLRTTNSTNPIYNKCNK